MMQLYNTIYKGSCDNDGFLNLEVMLRSGTSVIKNIAANFILRASDAVKRAGEKPQPF